MKNTLTLLFLAALTHAATDRPTAPSGDAPSTTAVEEAAAGFTFKGEPLHPKIPYLFHGSIADNAPPVVRTVDITAAGLADNEYFRGELILRNGIVEMKLQDSGTFGYRYLGRVDTNTCAIVTLDWGGGSAVFADVQVIRFQLEAGTGHLLAEIRSRAPLGGRPLEGIVIRNGRIHLPAHREGRESWPALVIDPTRGPTAESEP